MSADGRDVGSTQFASKDRKVISVPSSPSAIASAIDRSLICIGCSDGSVVVAHCGSSHAHARSIVDSIAKGPSEEWTGGVRGMCEVKNRHGERHWLIGHLNGLVDWLVFKFNEGGVEAHATRITEVAPLSELVFVGRLDAEGHAVLLSYARPLDAAAEQKATRIYEISDPGDQGGPLRLHLVPIEVEGSGVLERVRAVFPIDGERDGVATWLLLTHTAEVWQLVSDDGAWRCKRLSVAWSGAAESDDARPTWDDESGPALVMDAVGLGGVGCQATAARNQILLTTDVGVFLLRVEDGQRCTALALHGAGSRGTMLAIASFVEGAYVFAWCSDSHGMTHLYRTALVPTVKNAHWQRIHVMRGTSPALQALATHEQGSAFVWQIMRNQSVLAEQYLLAASEQGTIASMRRLEDARESAGERLDPLALVAHIFEPDPGDASQLWTFLGEPSADLALEALTELVKDVELEHAKVRIWSAVRLWTETLVGSIHRLLTRDESGPLADITLASSHVDLMEDLAFGVMRWLRGLDDHRERAFSTGSNAAHLRAALSQAARSQIFNVRRWTFYAPRPGSRMPRVARKLSHLEMPPGAANPPRFYEDRLAYQALLFAQRADDEGVIDEEPAGTVTDAARVFYTEAGTTSAIVAALWPRERVRFYRVRAFDEPGAELARCAFELRLDAQENEPRSRSVGASRQQRLALWSSGETIFVAVSERKMVELRDVECVTAYELPRLGRADSAKTPSKSHAIDRLQGFKIGLDYEIGSLHSIAPDRLAIGAESRSGAMLVVVDPSKLSAEHERPTIGFARLAASSPTAPAGVVAISSYVRRASGEAVLICGCSDGRVWRVDLPLEQSESVLELEAIEVGRLATSVSATAAAWVTHPDGSEPTFRVFAGGVDGTVLAWQRSKAADPKSPFTTLWATREQDAITQLEALEFDDQQKFRQVVMAVSRGGRALLVVNDAVIRDSSRSTSENPRKPRIPGQRIERFKLRSTAFACVLIHPRSPREPARVSAHEASKALLPSFRLCVVAGDNRVRLVGLHQPKRSEIRVQRFQQLGHAWASIVNSPGDPIAEHTHRGDHDFARYRFSEALRAVAPQLYLLPVTAWFEEDDQDVRAGMSSEQVHYPRYLRAFVRATQRYDNLRRELHHVELENVDRNAADAELAQRASTRIGPACDELVDELSLALRSAFDMRDKLLFEEIVKAFTDDFHKLIVEVVSKPACHQLQDACLEVAYRSLLEVFEGACTQWLAHDSLAYAQVQIARIKCVVNGRVLFHLTEGIGRRTAQQPLRRMVRSRLDQIARLLMDGHPLVPLETLRAVNLSILRACWLRLGGSPRARESRAKGMTPYSLDIDGLISTLDGFAARAAHGVEDALAHELARSYALCPFLSPSKASTAAFGLRAARLPARIVEVLEQQLDLLVSLLGLDLSCSGSEELSRGLAEFRAVLEPGQPSLPEWWKAWSAEWSNAFDPIGSVLESLDAVSLQLEQTPKKAKLDAILMIGETAEQLDRGQAESLHRSAADSVLRPSTNRLHPETHFDSDRERWRQALSSLAQVCRPYIPATPEAPANGVVAEHIDVVDPALVLAGAELARWAKNAIREFELAYDQREIHDPQYAVYLRILNRWRVATSSLSSSPAIQRTLVAGVLDHHLLERLDDLALRLWETAHTLDPAVRARAQVTGTAGRYARSLVQLLQEAETVPKNLRALYELIDDEEGDVSQKQHLGDMFQNAFGVSDCTGKGPIVLGRTARLLQVVIRELRQNADEHSADEPAVIVPEMGQVAVKLRLHLDRNRNEEQRKRLRVLADNGCRRFLNRQKGLHTSNGMGLYLAALAAASVGYRMLVEYPRDGSEDHVAFVLQQEAS